MRSDIDCLVKLGADPLKRYVGRMDQKAPAKRGRPLMYSKELGEAICAEIATSTKGLSDICKAREDFPSSQTVAKWRISFDDFAVMYARAKEHQMDLMAEEILALSDEPTGDAILCYDKDGKPYAKMDGMSVQRSKLMVDTRKWLMAKLARRTYGDTLDVTSGGEKLPAPQTHVTDQRVQSIVFAAQARMAQGPALDTLELEDEAKKLLG